MCLYSVSPETVKNCFHNAGFTIEQQVGPIESEESDPEENVELSSLKEIYREKKFDINAQIVNDSF